MPLSIAEAQEFKELKEAVARLTNQVRTLTDRQNEHHGSISYLKGQVKPSKNPAKD